MFKTRGSFWPPPIGGDVRPVSTLFRVNEPGGKPHRPVRISLLATGTVLALLALLAGCFPGKGPTVECEKWDKVAFWKTATAEMVVQCLEAGAEPGGWQGYNGWAPLHLAAAHNGNAAVIEALVAAGADPTAKEIYGATPLHEAAAENKNVSVVIALTAAGADPNAKENSGESPLHKAARNNTPAVVNALLNAGAVLNERDLLGETPLHEAAAYTTTSTIITALLKAGADPSAKNKDGKTPWDYAKENESLEETDAYWQLKERGD